MRTIKMGMVLSLTVAAVMSSCSVDVDSEEEQNAVTVNGVTVSGKVDNYTYVDLGLPKGTKWATYNIGATSPTDYGDYFAWGETQPKKVYNWKTYKWCEGYGNTQTKYCIDKKYGVVDDKDMLDADDDAATVNWSTAWRMPTNAELQELNEGCNWELVDDFNGSGVSGLLGTSKYNSGKIFLPGAGTLVSESPLFRGYGYYWSSSLCESSSNYAYALNFNNYGIELFDDDRYTGLSVRAVVK